MSGFKSDAQRRRFFANVGTNDRGVTMPHPMPPSFGWSEKGTRGDAVADRIYSHEERIHGSGVSAEFAAEQRQQREAFIESDARLSAEDKRKLLSYSGKFYK